MTEDTADPDQVEEPYLAHWMQQKDTDRSQLLEMSSYDAEDVGRNQPPKTEQTENCLVKQSTHRKMRWYFCQPRNKDLCEEKAAHYCERNLEREEGH